MSVLHVLDVVDFQPLAEAASRVPGVSVRRRGPYFEVSATEAYEIDRQDTGCRNAVWYSCVAALRDGHITVWDRDRMRIEPSRHE